MSTENERDDDERDDEHEGDAPENESSSESESEESEGSSSESPASSAPASASDDEDEEEEEGSAPAPAAARPAAKSGSAGARLAAAKAAKAAKKAAKKQALREEAGVAQQTAFERAKAAEPKDTQELLTQSPLGRATTRAAEWAEANRQIALGVAAVAALALVGWVGWSWWSSSQATAAGALLQDAIEISSAEIETPSEDGEEPAAEETDAEEERTFESLDARNEAALAAYRRVSSEYPSSSAAHWATLGEGRTLLAQGQNEEARTAYEAAFHASGDETVIAWQALEGIGASYEAEENWSEATESYERLSNLADGAYATVASYHLARMHAASGDTAGALTAFRELVDSLQEDSEEGEPPFPYVLAQAELRLRELDPSAHGSGPSPLTVPGGGADGLEGMDPEQIQELIRQLQTKSAGGAH